MLYKNDAEAREDCAGIHRSSGARGNVNDGDMTPTTGVDTPSMTMVRPMMAGSAPKRRTQKPCDNTATAGAPGVPSLSVNHLPSVGDTRSTAASDGVARMIMMRSGVPLPVNVPPSRTYA